MARRRQNPRTIPRSRHRWNTEQGTRRMGQKKTCPGRTPQHRQLELCVQKTPGEDWIPGLADLPEIRHKQRTTKPAGVSTPRGSAKRLWNWMTACPEFGENRAMYSDGWTWYPLTLQTLRTRMSRGSVLTTIRDNQPSACCIFLDDDKVLTMGFAAGEQADTGR